MEVESLQAQVSQEKELRAVMEGCLMEEKMSWKSVQAELQENTQRVQTLSGKLHTLRNTHTQLTQEDTRAAGKGVQNMPVLLLRKAINPCTRGHSLTSQNALQSKHSCKTVIEITPDYGFIEYEVCKKNVHAKLLIILFCYLYINTF